jgi:ribose-phosphate pyrophosphokinase
VDVFLVSTESSEPFARRLASHLGVPLDQVERRHFPDGERYLRLDTKDWFGILGRHVVIVGSTETPTCLDDVYRLGCAAVKHGARSLVLVVPYFGYSTMERATKAGEVVTAKCIARQLSAIPRAAMGNWLLMMDPHTSGLVHYFEGDTVALEVPSNARMVEVITSLGLERLTLASTDMGRAKWVEGLANHFKAPVALIHKRRESGSKTTVAAVLGDVAGRDVLIFDDMIRTGGSLVQAAEAYQAAGARSVHAAATHLVMPEGTLARLEASPLKLIIGTDTHPQSEKVMHHPRFSIASVADIFANLIGRLVY